MPRYRIYIPDIGCGHCKMKITKALQEIKEDDFEIRVDERTLIINPRDLKLVLKKLEEIDYPAAEVEEI